MLRGVVAAVLILVAGLAYSSWVLQFLWPLQLDPLRTFLSELDAAHRPHRQVYMAGDIITASCAVLAGALLLVPRPVVRPWPAVVAAVAFACFGAATLADVLSPIECIPGVDAGCPAERSGLFPQLHHIHALTSTLAVVSISVTMIAATVAAYRFPVWRPLRTLGLALIVLIAMSTIWMLTADNLHGDYRLGLAQRIQVGGMSVWLIVWAATIFGGARRRQRRSTMPAVDVAS